MIDNREKQGKDDSLTEKERIIQYAFATMNGIGRRTKKRLLEQFSEEEIFLMDDSELKLLLSGKEWSLYLRHKGSREIGRAEQEWEIMKRKQIHFLYYSDSRFPEKLEVIPDAPLALFYKGKIPKGEKSIAIVGSRIPTAYGLEMSEYFAKELSKAGVAIVSGMAFGIDVAAHKGALKAGGLTYGILGCGVDYVYPRENYSVYEQMIERGGILSEYKPGVQPDNFRFPERNRIISGLSDGVLIIEAKKKSGSLITADQALEQGKDVYALPGRSIDLLSEGCNWLIREGARMVTEPSHILEELFHLCENKEKNQVPKDNLLDNREKIVYDCLSLDPKSIEEIINETKFTVTEVISILFRLELNGYIRQIVRDYYIRCEGNPAS